MKTAAVIITFNPDATIAANLKAIARECTQVFIIDNGSTGATLKLLRAAAKKNRAKLVELGENTGIAHAQNAGLKIAFEKKADGVILFDHDSMPRKNFTASLWETYAAEWRKTGNPVIVGSRIYDRHLSAFAKHPVYRGFFFKRENCPNGDHLAGALMAIASGTLISREVFGRVGGMREDFFIDYVDWEYCLRARQKFNIQTVICGDAVLEHARGIRIEKRIAGLKVHPPGYSLFRYRQIFRNRARLFREYLFHNRAFIAFDLAALFRDSILLIFEKEPLKKIFWSALSWFQGFFRYTRQN